MLFYIIALRRSVYFSCM